MSLAPRGGNMRRLVWWVLFTLSGLWLQNFVPGVDFLAPGIIICLQEHLFVWGGWLALLWIVLQEGTGNTAFGATLLLYGGLVGSYFVLKCYFESGNIVFVLLLSAILAGWHFIVGSGLASLQDITISRADLLRESLIQFFVFPLIWLIGSLLYKKHGAR
jgi:hypothetical protein